MRLGIAGLLLLLSGPAMSGQPSPDLPCGEDYARQGARQFPAIEYLPSPLIAELMRHWGSSGTGPADVAMMIASRGADWQVTDVVIGHPLPSRRFIMGIGYADRFLVWYESGGIAHTYHLVMLASGDVKDYRIVADVQGTLPQLCRAAEQLGAARLHPD